MRYAVIVARLKLLAFNYIFMRNVLSLVVAALFVGRLVAADTQSDWQQSPEFPNERFVTETTDPYLNLFRRIIPPIGGGGFGLDLSPMIGIIVLFVLRGLVVALIAG